MVQLINIYILERATQIADDGSFQQGKKISSGKEDHNIWYNQYPSFLFSFKGPPVKEMPVPAKLNIKPNYALMNSGTSKCNEGVEQDGKTSR